MQSSTNDRYNIIKRIHKPQHELRYNNKYCKKKNNNLNLSARQTYKELSYYDDSRSDRQCNIIKQWYKNKVTYRTTQNNSYLWEI